MMSNLPKPLELMRLIVAGFGVGQQGNPALGWAMVTRCLQDQSHPRQPHVWYSNNETPLVSRDDPWYRSSPSRTMHKTLFRYQHIIPAIPIFVHHLILILSQLLHRRHSLLQLPHPLANPPPHFLSQLLVLSINDR